MVNKFTSTKAKLWDDVSSEYEETSFHRRDNLYPANSFRYELILDFLRTQPKGKVLDAGCGPGLMTRTLQKDGWDVVACDYSTGMIETSKIKSREENLPDVYHQLSLQELSKLNEKFEIVILNGVLPYISTVEEKKVFDEIKKVLKPGGFLIASHYNLYFDIFGMDKWSTTAIVEGILEPAGLPKPELEKAEWLITSVFKTPDHVLDKEKTMKLEDPIGYQDKLKNFGFNEFDQAYYNLFYLPLKFEAEQNQDIREELERKLCRDPKGLLLYRTFVSFAKLTS